MLDWIWGSKGGILDLRQIYAADEKAVKIAEYKYPKSEGWKHVWMFDHSSCHAAMAEDSLDVTKMNVNWW